MRFRVLGVALALVVAACATPKRDGPLIPPSSPTPPSPPTRPVTPPSTPAIWLPFSELPGWDREDHVAALEAFKTTCGVARDPATAGACRKARQLHRPDDRAAREFLETNFRATPVGGDGLLTAYFAPVYEGRISNRDGFTAPVMAKPDDLVMVDPRELDPSASGPRVPARIRGGRAEAYPVRETIEAERRGVVLAWMRPEDLFFLQIQGSGVLTFPDGRRKRVAFAAHNGRPFVGIAKPLRERGLLADNNTSGDSIKRWLAEHRGPEAEEIMHLNPRYVFFSIADDDGREPAGAAGIPLPPGRAIAVDNSRHAMGELFWIDASAPVLTDAFPVYRRLAVALDTGGAIKGDVRADLYMGKGDAAGAEAGRVRHTLRMYRLAPVGAP